VVALGLGLRRSILGMPGIHLALEIPKDVFGERKFHRRE
jgi:hypothetical protein